MSKRRPHANEDESLDAQLSKGLIDEDVPEDDRIIGRAIKISSLVALGLGGIALATWLVVSREAPVETVEEAPASAPQSLDAVLDVEPPRLSFTDVTRESGIDFVHVNGAYGERLLPETMGGGLAIFDYDNDGRQDLLFVDSRRWPWRDSGRNGGAPRLYRNLGDFRFEDVTAATGLDSLSLYGMGVSVADYDGDGFQDVYLTAVGPNRLLRNVEGRRFEDVTEANGVAGGQDDWSTSAAFFDADNDGDLDLFVCNYVEWSRRIDQEVDYRLTGIGRAYGPPTNYAGTFSMLFRNEGGRFVDVSESAGIRVTNPATGLPAGKALAVLPTDVDDDGWMDLVVANDTVQNFLFRNLGDGRFEEVGMTSGLAFDNSGAATGAMGLDSARFTDEGELAIAVGNFSNEMTSYYVSRRNSLLFTDQAIVSGIGPGSRQALSFGLFFFDADLDGRLDLLQTNGHVEDEINIVQPSQHYEQPTQLFWNCGPACARQFIQMADEAVGDLSRPVVGRGAGYGDLDGDGDLDVVITQVNRAPLILRNDQQTGHNWLRVRVHGPEGNPDALGARVRLFAGERAMERDVMPTRSYLTQVELPLTFGLAGATQAERLVVTWPDGTHAELTDVPAGQTVDIPYPDNAPLD
jgi:hypothetical protein